MFRKGRLFRALYVIYTLQLQCGHASGIVKHGEYISNDVCFPVIRDQSSDVFAPFALSHDQARFAAHDADRSVKLSVDESAAPVLVC